MMPNLSIAAVDLPWSTTFNCADWAHPNPLKCDGLVLHVNNFCIPAGYVTSGGTTTLVDTTVNFSSAGIQVGDIVGNTDRGYQESAITSITTTTNLNDTLHFSAMPVTNQRGDRYYIKNEIVNGVGNHTVLGHTSTISSASNNTSGGGGKGFRVWMGDGSNIDSATIRVDFTSAQKELWIRWYVRYQQGFNWGPDQYEKMLYIRTGIGYDIYPGWNQWGYFWFTQQGYAPIDPPIANYGWDNVMSKGSLLNGHRTADGLWHYLEVHIKMDTTKTPDWNGVAELWIDGVKRLSATNVNYSNANLNAKAGWWSVQLKSNQHGPHNGLGGSYVDIDDVAISNTGYIGLLSDSQPVRKPTLSSHLPAGW